MVRMLISHLLRYSEGALQVSLLAFIFAIPPVYSSVILQVSFDQLCEQSELIFEGRVTSISISEDPGNGNIWTTVSFEVIDTVKGSDAGTSLQLRFLGGTVGDVTLAISDLKIPELDEHGIYFVESLSGNLANPLLGWSQGQYLIESDQTGTNRITTTTGLPVTEIAQDPVAITRLLSADTTVADESTSVPASALTDALSVPEFKALILQNIR